MSSKSETGRADLTMHQRRMVHRLATTLPRALQTAAWALMDEDTFQKRSDEAYRDAYLLAHFRQGASK